MGYAVDHEDGLVLFDTGIGTGLGDVDAYRPEVHDLRQSLRDAGFDPAVVRFIVNCHLHFDHCGQNRSFPGVSIVAQRREREAARVPGYTVPEWVDFPGARYELVDGERALLPGLRVIPTPGHTPGHQSAILETGDGPVLLAGQAVQDRAEWESGVPAHASVDERASYISASARSVLFASSSATMQCRGIRPGELRISVFGGVNLTGPDVVRQLVTDGHEVLGYLGQGFSRSD